MQQGPQCQLILAYRALQTSCWEHRPNQTRAKFDASQEKETEQDFGMALMSWCCWRVSKSTRMSCRSTSSAPSSPGHKLNCELRGSPLFPPFHLKPRGTQIAEQILYNAPSSLKQRWVYSVQKAEMLSCALL